VARSFAVRGVVEGFYGTPWTHEARRSVISFLARRGMNAYV
jgi:hyaluronoglucosaminidase